MIVPCHPKDIEQMTPLPKIHVNQQRQLLHSPGRKARDQTSETRRSPIDPRPSGLGYERSFVDRRATCRQLL
jgi:hypothetical protein